MARVPVITSPCPLRFASVPQAGVDFCGQCSRRVHNLDGMSDAQRERFFATCSGEVCVAYTLPPVAAIAGLLGLGASVAMSSPAVAQGPTAPAPVVTGPTCPIETITLGGVDTARLQWVDAREAKRARPPRISEIDAAEWLPTPADSEAQPTQTVRQPGNNAR